MSEYSEEFAAPEDLEEPCPCDGCGEWVELQDMRACSDCYTLFCPGCLAAGRCRHCNDAFAAGEEGT